MNFGSNTAEADAFVIMDKALELGINFFDTADVYGGKKGEGITEQIVGRWLAQGGGRRDKIVLATKVFGNMSGDGADQILLAGLSSVKIRRACDASLRRLQTDHLDLYQMHHICRTTPWEETWQAMENLVQQGKILYCGSSNFAGWHIATANQEARRRNFLGLVCEQCKYSLATRDVETDVLPACKYYGLGVIAYSPLEAGILGGVLKEGDRKRRVNENALRKTSEVRPQLEKWEAFCAQRGQKPADVALAWVLRNPILTAPIIGPRTLDQLTGAVGALDVTLDEAALKQLDEIWPGPGAEAPECFAW
jgi:aryl-alcohol dehydrogenase-like predicted oxidoreductase